MLKKLQVNRLVHLLRVVETDHLLYQTKGRTQSNKTSKWKGMRKNLQTL